MGVGMGDGCHLWESKGRECLLLCPMSSVLESCPTCRPCYITTSDSETDSLRPSCLPISLVSLVTNSFPPGYYFPRARVHRAEMARRAMSAFRHLA
jgi:hypothetical protein